MRVYADLFFLLNAGADYMLLLAAGRLAGTSTQAWRLAAGATLGAAYALAALVLGVPAAYGWPGALLAAALMTAAAYLPRPPRVLLRLLGFLYGAAAMAAGLAMVVQGAAAAGGGLPLWGWALALGGTLVAAAAAYDRRRCAAPGWLCPLEVELGGRRTVCQALLDSGNRLTDPCGDGPAIVVDADVMAAVVPPHLVPALREGALAVAAALEAESTPPHWSRRFRLVPYRSVGNAGGLLPALRPDAVWIGAGSQRRAVRAVLAVSPTRLDPEGTFFALVPVGLLTAEPAPRPLPNVSEGGAAE